MKTRIAKDFRWEMGHRLPFHDSGCQNIHGHSYRLRVEITGEPDAQGMVMDYFDLKTAVQPLVDTLDHAFMCDESDAVMQEFFRENPMKIVNVPFSTTAENIARYILEHITAELARAVGGRIVSVSVRVSETETTFAEVQAIL